MRVFLYTTTKDRRGRRLQEEIEAVAQAECTEVFESVYSLAQRLRRPPAHGQVITVLLPGNRKELFEILTSRDLLDDVRIILILPDRRTDTIAKGHTLRPRYVSFIDSNFKDVAAVLKKMLENYSSLEGGETV